jgi:hypothetical protein
MGLGQRQPGPGWIGAGSTASLALLAFFWIPSKRRTFHSALCILAVMVILGGLAGCNSVSMNTGSATGTTTSSATPQLAASTYTITVSGIGNDPAKSTATTTFTLTVN